MKMISVSTFLDCNVLPTAQCYPSLNHTLNILFQFQTHITKSEVKCCLTALGATVNSKHNQVKVILGQRTSLPITSLIHSLWHASFCLRKVKETNEVEWTGKTGIRQAEIVAVGKAWKAIFWSPPCVKKGPVFSSAPPAQAGDPSSASAVPQNEVEWTGKTDVR